jgi:hypothetical protein
VIQSTRVCTICSIEKPLGEFKIHCDTRTGRTNQCTKCINARALERYYRIRVLHPKPDVGKMIPCASCGKDFRVRPSETRRRFCSIACRSTGKDVPCQACGKIIRSRPADPRKYCSRACSITSHPVECDHCGQTFTRRPCEGDRRFCSKRCAGIGKRVYRKESRACLTCGATFDFSPKPHSNSTGHYCSRPCYDRSLLGQYRGRPAFGFRDHRPGWASIARQFKAAGNDSCFRCGKKTGRLSVHHLEPYRIRQNNEFWNLVTACPKCHSFLERFSDWIEGLPFPCRRAAVLLVKSSLLRHRDHLRSSESGSKTFTTIQRMFGFMIGGTSIPSSQASKNLDKSNLSSSTRRPVRSLAGMVD